MADDSATGRTLAQARRGGNPDDIAEALARHANTLIEAGDISGARQGLDEAAAIHRQQGRTYDEARCAHLAAPLCRLEGDLEGARSRARHAAGLADPGSPIAVSAATELGEIALAQGNGPEAAEAYTRALVAGEAAGLIDTARAALLRKRAIARAMAGDHQEASLDLDVAHELLWQAGDREGAVRTLVEKASALHEGGSPQQAAGAIAQARQAAQQAGDEHALADLCLLEAAGAVQGNDPAAAADLARQARDHALAAVAPVSYLAAAVALSQLAESAGDQVGAYEALATGWVTLADLLGREAVRAALEPKLLELRHRWGPARFDEVKTAYEQRRRREMGQ